MGVLRREAGVRRWAKMKEHINMSYEISIDAWEAMFGKVTHENPYGETFWPGFHSFLAITYLPTSKHWHMNVNDFKRAWFTKPLDFSKANAGRRQDETLNPPSRERYPAFVRTESPTMWIMVCIHIALRRQKCGWYVDMSWVEVLPDQ